MKTDYRTYSDGIYVRNEKNRVRKFAECASTSITDKHSQKEYNKGKKKRKYRIPIHEDHLLSVPTSSLSSIDTPIDVLVPPFLFIAYPKLFFSLVLSKPPHIGSTKEMASPLFFSPVYP